MDNTFVEIKNFQSLSDEDKRRQTALLRAFMNDPYPNRAVREALSAEVNMPMCKINSWMSSRRQKYK